MFLTVIIVARNEENNIARCIESVLRQIKDISETEVILVDSDSTDRTVDIAKQYPINIIQLKPEWPKSPSAGRFSGVNNAKGKYILIIDGDMELLRGWVNVALDFLEKNHNCAAVMGKSYNIYNGDTSKAMLDRYAIDKNGIQSIFYVQQSSFFRKQFLDEVGNFQPFLRAEEEAEISYRLRKKGYSLYFIDYDSIYHYRPCANPLQETLRRIRKGLYPGMGDMLSWCLRKGYFAILYERFKVFFLFFLLCISSLIGFVLFLFLGRPAIAYFFIFIPFFFLIFQCIRKKSIKQGCISFINIAVITLSLLKGLFRKIPEIKEYPKDVIWIKRV